MSNKVSRMKFIFGADTKDFQKDVDQGKAAVQQFARQGTTAVDRFAQAFGVNTGAIRDTLGQTQTALTTTTRGFKAAATASGGFSAALKILKMALISTGIGALVVALGSLITFFSKTQRGADKFRTAMAGIKAAISVIIDRVATFGEGLFQLFSGKFKEGVQSIKASFKGIGAEIKEESSAARELEQRNQALLDSEIALTTSIANRRNAIAALLLKSKDETLSAEERRAAVIKANDIEKSIMEDQLALQQERVDVMAAQVGMGESLREEEQALADERAKLAELEAQSITRQRDLTNRYNELTRKIEAETAALRKNYAARDAILTQGLTKIKTGKADKVDTSELVDMSHVKNANDQIIASFQAARDAAAETNQIINESIQGTIIGMSELAGAMLLKEASFKDMGNMALRSLGGIMVTFGRAAVAIGVASEAIKQSITNIFGGGIGAIVAGGALIAAGSALKGLSAKGPDTSAVSASGAAGGSFSFDTRPATAAQKQRIQEIHISGTLKGDGKDLVAVIDRENQRKGIIT